MRHAGSALVVVLATAVIAMVAVAHPAPGTAAARAQPEASSVTKAVGPAGPAPVGPATSARAPGARAASAAQVVTGVVASTTAVQVGPGMQPGYRGTEPAYMTVSRSGSQTTVTVVPR